MSEFHIRAVDSSDQPWVARFIAERWGAEFVVAHREIYHCKGLPGFIAVGAGEKIGLVTYTISGGECEIVSLDSVRPCTGVGTALIEAVRGVAVESGCKRLWLVTTNDNMNALRFYQKRGFVLLKIDRGAVEYARQLKPIPRIGLDGVPIRDEIELEMLLDSDTG